MAGFDQASRPLGRNPVTSKPIRFRRPAFQPKYWSAGHRSSSQHNRGKHGGYPDAEFALNRSAHFPIGMPTIIIIIIDKHGPLRSLPGPTHGRGERSEASWSSRRSDGGPNAFSCKMCLLSPVELRAWRRNRSGDANVRCHECGTGYRRIELTTRPGKRGEFCCLVCDHVLELFDDSREVAIRLTVQPLKAQGKRGQMAGREERHSISEKLFNRFPRGISQYRIAVPLPSSVPPRGTSPDPHWAGFFVADSFGASPHCPASCFARKSVLVLKTFPNSVFLRNRKIHS